MLISTRKIHIRRVRGGYLLLFLVFAPIACWIFSKCFSTLFHDAEWNQTEENKTIKIETILNDSEGNETYPIDIKYFPESIRRYHEKYLRQEYDDQKYLNELKEMLQAKWDQDIVPLEHLKKLKFIISMQALRNPVTQASGLNIIYDFADTGFQYIKFGTPQNLFLLHHMTFDVIPAKYIGFHLVNMNVIGSFMFTMSRIFLPKSIDNIIHIHSSGKGLLDFFPRSVLPVQYGGNLTEYYAADWMKNANQQYGHFPAGGQKNIF